MRVMCVCVLNYTRVHAIRSGYSRGSRRTKAVRVVSETCGQLTAQMNNRAFILDSFLRLNKKKGYGDVAEAQCAA